MHVDNSSSRIFLSYRRDDSRWLARDLAERLAPEFGEVFMDVNAIEPGSGVTDSIHRAVGQCSVLLALIGSHWTDAAKVGEGRRLDNPQDWVAREISLALKFGITVIPVLIDEAVMPSAEQLPPDLKTLPDKNAGSCSGQSCVGPDCRRSGRIR